jgi:hypothetical protein
MWISRAVRISSGKNYRSVSTHSGHLVKDARSSRTAATLRSNKGTVFINGS